MLLSLTRILTLLLLLPRTTRMMAAKAGERLLPNGINNDHQRGDYSLKEINLPDVPKILLQPGTSHRNTFQVDSQHEKLTTSAGNLTGVRFNVETVPAALKEHLQAHRLTSDEIHQKLQSSSALHYNIQRGAIASKTKNPVLAEQIRIEVASEMPPNLIFTGGNGFLVACVTAFAQHLPLQLSPDHVWALITHAFAQHVDAHAEELRSKFVSHKGKKRIEIQTSDGFPMSDVDLGTPGASAAEWEGEVFAQFSTQIKDHIGESMHATVTADFSTTMPAARAVSEITLMAATKSYFSFGMTTCCGIPNITLLGAEKDWLELRERAAALGKLMTSDFSEYWMSLLLPLLDEFIESYRGNVNHGFWQSMVKLRHNGMGSGYAEFISGWIQIFFPYLKGSRLNKGLRPWQDMYFQGPEPDEFPPLISSVPVDWNYYGKVFNMDFHAGISGVAQDAADGSLMPVVSWHVTHSPPKGNTDRLKDIEEEIDNLLLGHKEEYELEGIEEQQPWYRRVKGLQKEAAGLRKNFLAFF